MRAPARTPGNRAARSWPRGDPGARSARPIAAGPRRGARQNWPTGKSRPPRRPEQTAPSPNVAMARRATRRPRAPVRKLSARRFVGHRRAGASTSASEVADGSEFAAFFDLDASAPI
jgi:hypothetical protein